MKILFICKGNVGRSQMAEALYKKYSNGSDEVISAGTKISGPEQPIGELMPGIREVLDAMNEEDVDVSRYVRKQLTEEMVESSDKVITVMEEDDELPNYLSNSPKWISWYVEDPKGKDLDVTRRIKNEIKENILNLI